jgi:cell division protein FtsB
MLLKRLTLGALVLINILLAYKLFFGENGLPAYVEFKDRHEKLFRELAVAERESMELSREIRLLRNDEGYLADSIRKRLNFVKDDEILYLSPEYSEPALDGAGAEANEDQD